MFGNIQWRAEYCVSDFDKFQYWKKNPIGIRIFLVNYWNNSIEDYFLNLLLKNFITYSTGHNQSAIKILHEMSPA